MIDLWKMDQRRDGREAYKRMTGLKRSDNIPE